VSPKARAAGMLLAWVLALAAALAVVVNATYSADLSAFLPRSPDARQRVLIEQLQSGAPSRLLFIGIAGGDAPSRAEASRALARTLRGGGLFEQVQNGEREAFARVGQWLFEHRYALSPAVDAERFTEAGLREALADLVSQLGTPGGAALRELLPRDPSGEMLRIGEALIPAQAPRSERGVWVGRNGAAAPRAVLLASARAAGSDLDALERAIAAVQGAFDASGAAARGLTLQVSGAPVFAVQSRALIHREVHWLATVGAILMAALLLVAFASPLALAAAVLPVGSGVLAGIAAVALGFGHVHGMTLGFGATLIGESVDYAIYYLVQARSGAAGAGPGNGWRRWLATGWPTVRLGLWTSLCGFAALLFSGFPGLAQLGVFSIAGLVGAVLTTRYLLPVLLPDGARGEGLRRALGSGALAVARRLPRLRGAVLAAAAAAFILIVWRGELWRADLAALNPLPPQLVALDSGLRNDLGASDARTLVVVQGADAESTLERTEAVAARLEALVEQGAIAGFESVTRFVPSQATQRRRLASLPAPEAVPALVRAATSGTPVPEAMLAPFAGEIEAARRAAPITLEGIRGSAVAPLVDALLLRDAGGAGYSALLPLTPTARGVDAARLGAAIGALPGVQVLDVKHELDALYQRYLREALWMALIGAAGVLALVAATLRSPRRVLAVCQPLALAVVLTLGGLAAVGASLGILHLVGLLLVVAVGSNYALFFDLLQSQPADADTLASLLLANATTVVSFGLLAFSAIPALSAIGVVVAPGALLALVLAAAFAPQAAGARHPV
jgi:predicted exporter